MPISRETSFSPSRWSCPKCGWTQQLYAKRCAICSQPKPEPEPEPEQPSEEELAKQQEEIKTNTDLVNKINGLSFEEKQKLLKILEVNVSTIEKALFL